MVCLNAGGLKKAVEGEMVHPICGLMSPNIVVEDYLDMRMRLVEAR
jgi:hypothetical protein